MKRSPWAVGLGGAALVALAVAGIGLALRPAASATAGADVATPIVVIPPQVVALDGLEGVSVSAEGPFDVRYARPDDAFAWAVGAPVTVVRGLDTWDSLRVDSYDARTGAMPDSPGDIWRRWTFEYDEATIVPIDVEAGVAIVVVGGDEARPRVEMTFSRDRGGAWAWVVLASGFGVLAVALLVFAAALIDFAPFRAVRGRMPARFSRSSGTSADAPARSEVPRRRAKASPPPAKGGRS